MENKQSQLPTDIMRAIDSSEVYTELEKIGDKYNLLLDQVGELNMHTESLMVGKLKTKDFVNTIAKDLEIPNQTAQEIAADINTEIFTQLRESLRKMQELAENPPITTTAPSIPTPPVTPVPPPPIPPPAAPSIPTRPVYKPIPTPTFVPNDHHSILEKVGGITIETRPFSNSPQYKDTATTLNREDVMNDLENIYKLQPSKAASFVEHLLANPVITKSAPSSAPLVPTPPVAPATPAPIVPKKRIDMPPLRKDGIDPYREEI